MYAPVLISGLIAYAAVIIDSSITSHFTDVSYSVSIH